MKVFLVPAFLDNYFFILNRNESWAVVDPGNSSSVIDFLDKKQIKKLDFIFNTHHHQDHAGGNLELKNKYKLQVLGSLYDENRIPGIDKTLKEGDSFLFDDLVVKVFFCPGHTSGHIAYWFESEKKLFCGDVLFSMGCGRLFEGTHEEMFESLEKLKKLPEDTEIFCAHEYTEKNLNFALQYEPENQELLKRQIVITDLRRKNQATVPFTLKSELETNPFLRLQSVSLKKHLNLSPSSSELEVFCTLRNKRNDF